MRINILKIGSLYYPECLKDFLLINDIHYVGELLSKNEKSVVIIGSRECTRYGIKVTRALVKYLVRNGISIVSGLDRGIDSCANLSAIEFGGRSIGFLGYGLYYLG